MSKEQFVEIRFKSKSLEMIKWANTLLEAYKEAGYIVTVRQLYYRFVANGWLENTVQNYRKLASVIDDGRKAGLIDWGAIQDRTRFVRKINTYGGPQPFLDRMIKSYYAEPTWDDQPYYVEVGVEKDAQIGTLEPPCTELRVPYWSCRGYASSSELYLAGKRFQRALAKGKKCIFFHLGDHDPSGLDMTRVNDDSLNQYARAWGRQVEVRRLALNMDQVEEYNPPPNVAKDNDPRYEYYRADYGETSWELDALEPATIDKIIRDAVMSVMEWDRFQHNLSVEAEHRARLLKMAENWGLHDRLEHVKEAFIPAQDGEDWFDTSVEDFINDKAEEMGYDDPELGQWQPPEDDDE